MSIDNISGLDIPYTLNYMNYIELYLYYDLFLLRQAAVKFFQFTTDCLMIHFNILRSFSCDKSFFANICCCLIQYNFAYISLVRRQLIRVSSLWQCKTDGAHLFQTLQDDVTLVTKPVFVVHQSSSPKIPVNLSFQE
jgi:hypothetical protein